MVRAVSSGVIDYAKFNSRDVRHLLREQLLLLDVSRDVVKELSLVRLVTSLVLFVGERSQEGLRAVETSLINSENAIIGEHSKVAVARSIEDAYKEEFGNLTAEEVERLREESRRAIEASKGDAEKTTQELERLRGQLLQRVRRRNSNGRTK